MKTRTLVGACGLAILLTISACSHGFVEYGPLKLRNGPQNKLIDAPELNTPDHLERLKIVLDFYHERWQTNSDGKLLITRKLHRDRELLWNYTKKAEDPQFVENARAHRK